MTPISVLSMVSLILGILLVLADKFLADYGECKINISGEDEFTIRGGDVLLTYLTAHGINVPAACAGKASCGYCKVKVLNGDGQVLPTEKGFLTRDDIKEGIRLACQVKVKSDMEIFMPDFIETVKNIVANELYDPSLNWRFNISDRETADTEKKKAKKKKAKIKSEPEGLDNIYEIIRSNNDSRGSIMPILQQINNEYNYLPDYALKCVSNEMNIPLSEIFRIATFYNVFSLTPRGKNIIKVCLGTACHVKGAPLVVDAIERELGISPGQTTEDLNFTLETVACLGCCGLAPVITVGENIYGKITQSKIPKLIKEYT
ncbi:NAD(P)H-dependent oxidoreductase subunit E [Candidatus Latescibacterota bacterium]